MLKWLMFSCNFSHEFSLIDPSGDSCWYEWRTTGYRPHWGCTLYILLFLPWKKHEYGSTLRVRFGFLTKLLDICLLNKGKPLNTQRSGHKDVPVTSYPQGPTNAHLNQDAYLSNWLQPTHMEFFVFPCCLLITAPMFWGVLFHICVFFDGWTKSCSFWWTPMKNRTTS